MPAKKAATKSFVKYHTDGSIWAKGKMKDDQPDGYWEWFRKDGVIMRSGILKKVNRLVNGLLMIRKARLIRLLK